jgi:hypothetical protein
MKCFGFDGRNAYLKVESVKQEQMSVINQNRYTIDISNITLGQDRKEQELLCLCLHQKSNERILQTYTSLCSICLSWIAVY